MVDLTHLIHPGMLRFDRPWHTETEVEQLASIPAQGRETRRIVLGSHCGTHVDAPAHFIQGGATAEALDLDVLLGPARVVDFSALPPLTPVTAAMLAQALGSGAPKRLLLRYGWDRFWGENGYYRGHPYLTPEAAMYLVEAGVRLLGMDTPMPDNPEPAPGAEDSPIHKILLRKGTVLLEYLCDLDKLSASEFMLFVLPLKVQADGAPARCVAYDGGALEFADRT